MSPVQIERKWSPIEIETLLRCYYTGGPFISDSPAQSEAIKTLFSHNLIRNKDQGSTMLTVTSRGIAFVNLILSLELPVEVWIDEHCRILHEKKEL